MRRARDAAFRSGWDRALSVGYAQLEMMMLERALHGVEKVVVARDGSREVMREYSDRIGLALLRMHRDNAGHADEEHGPEEVAEAAERILARLKKIAERVETEGEGDGTEAPSTIPACAGTHAARGGGAVETKAAVDRLALIVWAVRLGRR